MQITVFFIADIVGKPGVELLEMLLPGLQKKYRVDFTIANGENANQGIGINEGAAKRILNAGVNLITGGNHIWTNWGYRKFLATSDQVIRPLNYPAQAPGKGSAILKSLQGFSVAVMNLQGRTFMYPIDCPFTCAEKELKRLYNFTPVVIVDFHAEASAEKMALGRFLDGKVSAVIGTHTHVQTADEQIFPKGTGYITDAGMTGPHESVIGMDINVAVKRFMTQLPEKYELATENNRLCGVLLKIDSESGNALEIERINLP
ncbi:TIGR00282 family metallophosphoesterase [candidate division KSB1 bacterium]|nr:TIGR00282 family metallophosphoesterase [candidate division KSB1 bacterium]